jgi:hypothetical protein
VNLTEYALQYAPTLAHLVPALEEHDAVICGYSAGPQKPDDPEAQNLCICIYNPWQKPDQWVTIYSSSHCEWWSHGEQYQLTFEQLLAYLRQLPRPLHSFSRYCEEDV